MTGAERILGRDVDSAEHVLTVTARCGLVCVVIGDQGHRIMSPAAATMLCLDLVEVLFKQRQRDAGPLSSTF
jgi:hypothetical protein